MAGCLRHLGNRVAFAYSGALLVPVALLPLAYAFPQGGHSLMFFVALGAPAGAVLGLLVADFRMGAPGLIILLRAVLAVAVLLGCLALLASADQPFVVNRGWVLMLPLGPLAAALTSMFGPQRGATR